MLDRRAVTDLLATVGQCEHLIIQGLPDEAEKICRMLSVEHLDLGTPLVPYGSEF